MRGTVRAKAVALTKPQQVRAKLIWFFKWLSVTPTLSRIFDRKYLRRGQVTIKKRDVMSTYEVKPFPDHCVARPKKDAIKTRLRIPGVAIKSFQPVLEFSFSSSSVVSISAYSALTKGEVTSPSAWYLARMPYASSPRPFEMSQLKMRP